MKSFYFSKIQILKQGSRTASYLLIILSGDKIISMPSKSSDKAVRKISNSFISERAISYWNKLPRYVKGSESVNDFNINLEGFKRSCSNIDTGNFWEVSDLVLGKIERN